MSEGREKSAFTASALPEVIHEAVRREIAQMNTAICQATQNSPIKVSLTWRLNPRFTQLLSERVLDCVEENTSMEASTAISCANALNIEKSFTNLERYVTGTIERLERVLSLLKAVEAEIVAVEPPTVYEEARNARHQ